MCEVQRSVRRVASVENKTRLPTPLLLIAGALSGGACYGMVTVGFGHQLRLSTLLLVAIGCGLGVLISVRKARPPTQTAGGEV